MVVTGARRVEPIAGRVDRVWAAGREVARRLGVNLGVDRAVDGRGPVEGVTLGCVDRGRHGREGYRPATMPTSAGLGGDVDGPGTTDARKTQKSWRRPI